MTTQAGFCSIHYQSFPCRQCSSGLFGPSIPPMPSLFQFGAFFRWACKCGVEIYATSDETVVYQREVHKQKCALDDLKGETE